MKDDEVVGFGGALFVNGVDDDNEDNDDDDSGAAVAAPAEMAFEVIVFDCDGDLARD